jgi:hypothetical protein
MTAPNDSKPWPASTDIYEMEVDQLDIAPEFDLKRGHGADTQSGRRRLAADA